MGFNVGTKRRSSKASVRSASPFLARTAFQYVSSLLPLRLAHFIGSRPLMGSPVSSSLLVKRLTIQMLTASQIIILCPAEMHPSREYRSTRGSVTRTIMWLQVRQLRASHSQTLSGTSCTKME